MPSGRTNNFPVSGRGQGHVTPTIFGSSVGYPSDSLASCYFFFHFLFLVMCGKLRWSPVRILVHINLFLFGIVLQSEVFNY